MFHLLLLFIIYLAFISLGLPDALLGSAWPNMVQELGEQGIYQIVISPNYNLPPYKNKRHPQVPFCINYLFSSQIGSFSSQRPV